MKVPAQVLKFAETVSWSSIFPPPCALDSDPRHLHVQLRNQWSCTWTSVVKSSLRSTHWTPKLVLRLAGLCPYDDPEYEVTTALLGSLKLDLSALKTVVHMPLEAAAAARLIWMHASDHHFDLLGIEVGGFDEDIYQDAHEFFYEDDLDNINYFTNLAQACAIVVKHVELAPMVVLELVRQLVKHDTARHDAIETNTNHHGFNAEYDSFVLARGLIARWGASFDFLQISSREQMSFLEGIANFEQRELRHDFLALALGWIRRLVLPVKNATSLGRAGRGALGDVERICVLLASSSEGDTATT